jgi:uncharacterized protein (TIGR01777 family)
VPSFVWDVDNKKLDPAALEGIDAIIHLAGAGVADQRWSRERKQEIMLSRTRSSILLYETLKTYTHQVKTVVSASAIGFYGFSLDNTLLTEASKPGTDFLSKVVIRWENEVDSISTLGIRVARIRIGIVLSDKGGALKEMARPVRWGVGSPLGTGKQIVSWIHLDDLCGMFIKAVEDVTMSGAYNAVAPYPVTNREMTNAIANVLHRSLWLPPVPGFVLSMLVGEMAEIVLNGSNVSSERIQKTGFKFQFPQLTEALKDLLQNRPSQQPTAKS